MAGVFYSTLFVFVVATVVFILIVRQLNRDQNRSKK